MNVYISAVIRSILEKRLRTSLINSKSGRDRVVLFEAFDEIFDVLDGNNGNFIGVVTNKSITNALEIMNHHQITMLPASGQETEYSNGLENGLLCGIECINQITEKATKTHWGLTKIQMSYSLMFISWCIMVINTLRFIIWG